MPTPRRIARIVIEERKFSVPGHEQQFGGGVIEHPAGNPLRLEILFTRSDTIIADADITGVSASVLAVGKTGDSFADAASAGFDTTVTGEDWAARTKQSAVIEFSGPQLELAITGNHTDYEIEFYFGDYTIGWITLRIYRDGVPAGQLPVQAGNLVPDGATYDGDGEYAMGVSAGTFYIVAFGANDTDLDNGGDPVADSLTVFQAAAATLTLRGTADQPVTAIVRPNPVATTQFLQQLLAAMTGQVFASFFLKSKDSNLYYRVSITDAAGTPALYIDEDSATETP